MKRRISLLIALVCVSALCMSLMACSGESLVDRYTHSGYTVSVYYDANGGQFLDREGITIADMFKPSSYEADADGKIYIKLMDPTDPGRPTSSGNPITLTRTGYFYVGWYTHRELIRDDSGNVVDADGAILTERNGSYYKTVSSVKTDDDGNETVAMTEVQTVPSYTYSGYWDFEEDRLEYSQDDGAKSFTLYAGWVKNYDFNYYYNNGNEWVQYANTNFNYKETNKPDSTNADDDIIWVPRWTDGEMSYKLKGQSYEFPGLKGMTFDGAFLDPSCTETSKIDDSYEHPGSLNLETGTAVDRVQNIYVKFVDGVRYKIKTAEQLRKYAQLDGYYEIMNDIDFTGFDWPATFEKGTFTGKMFGSDGKTVTISNATARHDDKTVATGGLFGVIDGSASIENIHFENAEFIVSDVNGRLSDISFGLFAGLIEDDATLTNVGISGRFSVEAIKLFSDFKLNLVANGNISGITVGELEFVVKGDNMVSFYNYTFDPDTVVIGDNYQLYSAGDNGEFVDIVFKNTKKDSETQVFAVIKGEDGKMTLSKVDSGSQNTENE